MSREKAIEKINYVLERAEENEHFPCSACKKILREALALLQKQLPEGDFTRISRIQIAAAKCSHKKGMLFPNAEIIITGYDEACVIIDQYKNLIVECERIFGCSDTHESPAMSNLPNLCRDAVAKNENQAAEIKRLKEIIKTAQPFIGAELTRRRKKRGWASENEATLVVKLGQALKGECYVNENCENNKASRSESREI